MLTRPLTADSDLHWHRSSAGQNPDGVEQSKSELGRDGALWAPREQDWGVRTVV